MNKNLYLFCFAGLIVLLAFLSIPVAYGMTILWEKHVDGMIWSIDISGNNAYVVAGVDLGDNRGKIYLFNKNGSLLWSQEVDRRIGRVAVSDDGSFVLASGYQLSSGAAAIYQNPSVYLFNQNGKLLWKFQNTNMTRQNPENQFLIGTIAPPENNIMIQADYEIFFLDNFGNLLWSYPTERPSATKISDDGFTIAVGANNDQSDHIWQLYVFDKFGNLKWKHEGTDGIIQGNALAISADGQHIVIGSMKSGEVGNLYKFDKKGNVLWQQNIAGGVLNVDMSDDSSSIVVGTNNGMVLLDQNGNQFASHSTWFPTISSDGKFIAASGFVGNDDYGVAFFDEKLNQIWQKPNAGSDVNKISKDGAFVIAATRSPDYSSKLGGLYFFEGQPPPVSEELLEKARQNIEPAQIVISYDDPPLKQFNSGIPFNEIQCKENLILIQKYDGFPACVKPETVPKLIERGWTIETKPEPKSEKGNDFAINEETYNPGLVPPPMPLSTYGDKVSSIDVAKTQTGLVNANLPSYIPSGLVLESIRTMESGVNSRIIAIYQPRGVTTTEDTTIQKSVDNGLVLEIIREESDSSFDWNGFVEQQVKEAPDVRSSVTINGYTVMLLQSNPDYQLPYAAKVFLDDQQITVYSTNLNTDELKKVVSSILIN